METAYQHTLDIAKKMLAENCDMDRVAKLTRLSLEEVQELAILNWKTD